MFDGGFTEAFEGLAGAAGGPEVGVRIPLTLLVILGALVLCRVAARAFRISGAVYSAAKRPPRPGTGVFIG